MLKFELSGKSYDVVLNVRKYHFNNNTALTLETPDGLPFAVLTVNLNALPPDYAYLDVNNVPSVEKFVVDNGIGEFVEAYAESGYCRYPLYKLDLDKCAEYTRRDL